VTKKTPGKSRPAAKSVKNHRQPAKATTSKPKAQLLRTNAKKNSTSKPDSRKKPQAEKHASKPIKHAAPAPKSVKVAAKAAAPAAETRLIKPEAVAAPAMNAPPAMDIKSKIAAAAAKADPKAQLKKNGSASPETAQPGTPAKEDPDAPMLDMSDAAVRKMITRAKQRGYVTYDELNRVLPSDKVSSEQIEDTMAMLNEMGINVIESEEQEEAEGEQLPATVTGRQVAEVPEKPEETYDRTDDPVRMYLREMGSVELLSREGEIAIAKRIEAGRELMIGALCESPLTFEALTVWRDELMEGKALLRDIIDLEAMYGGVPGAEGPLAQGLAAVLPGLPVPPTDPAGIVNGAPPPIPPVVKPVVAAPPPVLHAPERVNPDPAPGGNGADPTLAGEPPIGGDDDFDDESNMSLSAMEAALKPQVLATLDQIATLYKRLGKLQDAQVEAALGAEELSTSQERRFQKLRNETVDLVKSLRLNNNRIEALVDQMYGINRRLMSLEGRLIRLADARGVERAVFLKQ